MGLSTYPSPVLYQSIWGDSLDFLHAHHRIIPGIDDMSVPIEFDCSGMTEQECEAMQSETGIYVLVGVVSMVVLLIIVFIVAVCVRRRRQRARIAVRSGPEEIGLTRRLVRTPRSDTWPSTLEAGSSPSAYASVNSRSVVGGGPKAKRVYTGDGCRFYNVPLTKSQVAVPPPAYAAHASASNPRLASTAYAPFYRLPNTGAEPEQERTVWRQ